MFLLNVQYDLKMKALNSLAYSTFNRNHRVLGRIVTYLKMVLYRGNALELCQKRGQNKKLLWKIAQILRNEKPSYFQH